jgi:filamentous hemagglutinin family protein
LVRANSPAGLRTFASIASLIVGAAALPYAAQAQSRDFSGLPQGSQVISGAASTQTIGNTVTVKQASKAAVIVWKSFSIASGNSVTFQQPDAQSVSLNLVSGGSSSVLAGSLSANGSLILLNPNGIAITSDGIVNVGGGFVASTLGLDAVEGSGQLKFKGGGSSAAVSNAGHIMAGPKGFAALIGGSVSNAGLISVPMGRITLAAGEAATIDTFGDGFLQIALGEGSLQPLPDTQLLQTSGSIARSAWRRVVSLSPAMVASDARIQGESVILSSGIGDPSALPQDGNLTVKGKLDASSSSGQGGTVTLAGHSIALHGAVIDASGTTGGGTITVGGGNRGEVIPGLANAKLVTIDPNSIIRADSTSSGNAGNVTVWSDDVTSFAGAISAQALGNSGDGGETEVSGSQLEYLGRTSLLARNGKTGNLLIDPYNLTISAGSQTGTSGFTASATGANINTTTLQNALATANVTIATGASGAEDGDITVADAVSWSANTSLTLKAAGAIKINAAISNSGAASGLTLTAAGSGGIYGAGAIANSGALTLNVIHAAADGTLSGVISGSGTLAKAGPGRLTLSGANTYTGATTVSGGTLQIGNGATGSIAASSAVSTANGATLALNLADGSTFSNVVDNLGTLNFIQSGALGVSGLISGWGASTLTQSGSGTTTISGVNTYSGKLKIYAGTVKAGSNSPFGASNLLATTIASGATLDLAGFSATTGSLGGSGKITNSAANPVTLNINVNNQTGVFDGVIEDGLGAVSLSLNGFGSQSLNGMNTFTGSIETRSGLIIGGSGTLGGGNYAGAIRFFGPVASFRYSSSANQTLSGIISGIGPVTKDTGAASTLTLSGANNFVGAATVNAGTLKAGSSAVLSFSNSLNVGVGAAFDLNGYSVNVGGLAGAGTVTNQASGTGVTLNMGGLSGNWTFPGAIHDGAGQLAVTQRQGSQILSGANTYTGATRVTAGTLRIGNGTTGSIAPSSAVSTANGSTLELNLASGSNFSNAVANSGALNFAQSGSLSLSGSISGVGRVIQSGLGTTLLAGANTYTGATTVSAGTLQFSKRNALYGGNTANWQSTKILVSSGAMLALSYGGAGEFTASDLDLIKGLGSTSGGFLSGSALGIDTSGGDQVYAGAIANPNGGANVLAVRKLGANRLTLTGANSYTGATTVSGGMLDLAGSLDVGAANAGVVVATGASFGGSGVITANTLIVSGPGDVNLTGNNRVEALAGSGTTGALLFNNSRSLKLGSIDAGSNAIRITTNPGSLADLTLSSGATLKSSAIDLAVILAADRAFINNAGPNGISAANGRWLIYSAGPDGNSFGGLDSANTAFWNATFASSGGAVAGSGNRYVFAMQPRLTFTSTDLAKTYGEDAATSLKGRFVVSGYRPGIAGAFLGDTADSTWVGSPSLSSAGSAATAAVAGGAYAINIGIGTLASLNGYALDMVSSGNLTIDRAPLTITGGSRRTTYNGSVQSNGYTITAGQLYGSDRLTGVAGLASATNAGTYVDSLANATGSGLGNYDITYVNGSLVIDRAPLTVIGANSRFTYNSSSQTNNGPALNGLQGADSFTITGIAAGTVAGSFTDRLGLTANGGTLASNYDVHITNGSLTIDRAPLTITGGSRRTTYDGSAQNNGYTITAGQLYGSDRVTGVAGLASATNAGTYVDNLANATGSGLGNYDITYVNGSLVIDRAPLTVTARDAVVAYSGVPWSGGAGFDIAGLVQADTLESITGSLTWGGDSQGAVAVGRYVISLGGLSNPNYTIAWNPGSLTVKIPALYSSPDSFTGHQRALMAANSNGQPAVVPEGSPLITLVECLQRHCLFRAPKLPKTLYRQVKLSVRADLPR